MKGTDMFRSLAKTYKWDEKNEKRKPLQDDKIE